MEQFKALYTKMQPQLLQYFYVRTASVQIAEDLTQDVFYEALKAIHRYRGDASLSSWIFSIANNLLKKHYRAKKYEHALYEKLQAMPEPTSNWSENDFIQREQLAALLQTIATFSESDRELVLLRIYSELSFKEIGEILGKTENYARVQFHRLKVQIKLKGDI